ncbi:hypothetical protein NEIMUCOT_04876 [Neisseria mucosa ATCC 25996]|uniref:Uncharacterized protein n=1 Tax=Neisseria mucosa (strain ATCC 25996 / DSM 4631 / NCTC 10774 / M26) TaxID=546266 RepID=D2ZW83_NEIM2|nr:hypothetical protein NEIMUCOT_04876 [Neisseria mucosa ATCC 25996]
MCICRRNIRPFCMGCLAANAPLLSKYSGLTLNQYGVASP